MTEECCPECKMILPNHCSDCTLGPAVRCQNCNNDTFRLYIDSYGGTVKCVKCGKNEGIGE
jgi:hypothetical protein